MDVHVHECFLFPKSARSERLASWDYHYPKIFNDGLYLRTTLFYTVAGSWVQWPWPMVFATLFKDGGKDKHLRYNCWWKIQNNYIYETLRCIMSRGITWNFLLNVDVVFLNRKDKKTARWIPIQSCQVIRSPPQGAGGPISMYAQKNHRNEAWWRWLKVVSLGRVAPVFIHPPPPWLKMSYIPEN